MNTSKFEKWLEQYGIAWVSGDPEAIASLFSEDCCYYETPFDVPMVGKPAVSKYWAEGARDGQEAVTFHSSTIAIENMAGYAHWEATFKRKPTNVFVKLDGVLFAKFNKANQCEEFKEWWHRYETKLQK